MRDAKRDAVDIFCEAVDAVLPEEAVRRALAGRPPPVGRRIVVAVGKAAWRMAAAAAEVLAGAFDGGIVVTKHGHAAGDIPGMEIHEAGHPVPDAATFRATERALALTEGLTAADEVVLLLSGGGSALFERPLPGVSPEDVARLNEALLASGAGIGEMNVLRKRFSAVKGGRFAAHCAPARIYQIVLSDVVGDRLESIASGPACADPATAAEAARLVARYGIELTPRMAELLAEETPKRADNVETVITGSVRELCRAAAAAAEKRGYRPCILATTVDCEAREAGRFVAALAREAVGGGSAFEPPCALILGGETVVRLRGGGKGGRNQELALAAAEGLRGVFGATLLSAGSDGTDGPTNAAGGVVGGDTWNIIAAAGVDPLRALDDNDSWTALRAADALVVTGPTGTNVNDLILALCETRKAVES